MSEAAARPRFPAALWAAALLGGLIPAGLAPTAGAAVDRTLPPPTGVRVERSADDAVVSWDPYTFPGGTRNGMIQVQRDGEGIGSAPDPATSFVDVDPPPGGVYRVRARAQRNGQPAEVLLSDWVVAETQVPPFLVGAATATLNPTVDAAPPDGQVFLGGFGLGAVRRSEGVLGSGASARAFVVDDGEDAVALVQSDNQGIFAAYELGRPAAGTVDIAKAVEALRPGLAADHIVIASTHSHAGQDLIGVWGGVPNEYLQFVKDQTVQAIVDAYDRRELADLSVGSIGGIVPGDQTSILNSQFDDSSCAAAPTPNDPGHTALPCTEPGDFPQWDLVDDSVRILHATRPDGSTVATFVNFAAHSTVMGSGNRLISSDWPSPTAEKIEEALGGTAVVMPAANGRTQPDRGGGTDAERLETYATTISGIALQAVASAVPVQGDEVEAKKRLIFEAGDNAGLLALLYAGQAGCFVSPQVCVPIMRAKTPPWLTGAVIGTVVSAVRVGDVLFTGTPGEPYPQIAFGIQDGVDAGPPGWADISHHFIFSLSDDQLGYLIAPTEGVPFAALKTAATGNDNFLFNVAAGIGDHVMCTGIDLALDVGLPVAGPQDSRCALWSAEPDLNPVTGLPNP